MSKKIFYCLVTLVMIAIIGTSASHVLAADPNGGGIIVLEDENQDEVGLHAVDTTTYFIEVIRGEDAIGRVYSKTSGEQQLLGTCTVILVDSLTNEQMVLCSDQGSSNSYGSITIVITDSLNHKGYVSSTTGNMHQVFALSTILVVTEK